MKKGTTKKYRYLPHSAEVKFVAYGNNFEKALENAAEAMLNVMLDIKAIKKEAKNKKIGTKTIQDKAKTREDLAWYTLQDILSEVDRKGLAAYGFKVESLKQDKEGYRVKGSIVYVDTSKDFSLLEVKAVTPSGLKVNRSHRWSIEVVLDV